MNALEQVVRGYLCGANDSHQRNHLLNINHLANRKNVKTYFYRFEFQKRVAIHLHLLVWLDNVKYIQQKTLQADLPRDNAPLLRYVEKYQPTDKSSLPIHDGPTTTVDDKGTQCLQLSHLPDAFAKHLRGYIHTLLPLLQCSMDAQTTNGHGMILKYAAFRFQLLYLDICGREMWVLLSLKKISWSDGTRKKFTVPTPESAEANYSVAKYHNRPVKQKDPTILSYNGYILLMKRSLLQRIKLERTLYLGRCETFLLNIFSNTFFCIFLIVLQMIFYQWLMTIFRHKQNISTMHVCSFSFILLLIYPT